MNAPAAHATTGGKNGHHKEQATATDSPRKAKHADRFAVLNAFVDVSLRSLCRGDIAVWLVLYRDTKNGTARTGQTDIARRTGLSTRGVRKALARLEANRLVRCVHRGGLGRGASRFAVLPIAATNEEPIGSG
jgi:hypothetical protein